MENLDALAAIFTRRSIRRFSSRSTDEQTQNILLRAAFAAPSAENARTRHFIVISSRDKLDLLPTLHPSAGPAREAPLAILICCDTSAEPQTVFWPQDCAAAAQNIMLAARALGLGSLWCGIHPMEAREQAFISAFSRPAWSGRQVSSFSAIHFRTSLRKSAMILASFMPIPGKMPIRPRLHPMRNNAFGPDIPVFLQILSFRPA